MQENSFFVGDSTIEGNGLFASRDIEKGEVLYLIEGTPMSFTEFEELHAQGDASISCNHLQTGTRQYIKIDGSFVFGNHSCEPNAAIQGERAFTTLCAIKKGEEIVYDYSATEWTVQDYPPYYTDGWPMICHCGSSMCRGKIACFPYLPEEIKQKYLTSGVIQDYIFERLKEPVESSRCFICEKYLNKKEGGV